MGRRKKEPMDPAKKNIVSELIKTYDIKTAKDIQEALKDLLGETLQDMLEAEMNEHLGYEKYTRDDESNNYRNGYKTKKVRSSMGELEINVPQDRDSEFEPQIVKKRQKDISEIEQKIINLYASGMSNKTIIEEIEDIYGFELSESLISDITDKVIPKIEEWKNRGLKDIIILCADGLSGIKESINAAFPNTEYQRCIVHQVRNTLKYVSYKDKKEFASDLKSIYLSNNEEQARQNLDAVDEKWSEKYPNAMKSWYVNWDCITPIFKFSPQTRKVIYTTNAIESLNSQFKRLNRSRSVFSTKLSLEKALYLSIERISRKWTHPIRNWGVIFGELSIMYEERIGY